MKLSKRSLEASDSITLKLNEVATRMSEDGQHVYNLTSGQLPFKPSQDFISKIESQLNFLKSYQYSPVPGYRALREKLTEYVEKKREIDFDALDIDLDCVINHGSKHTLYNVLGTLIDPGDEVILLAPYWVSYPHMVKFWGGEIKVVDSNPYDAFISYVEDIESQITDKTKAIIINSPNNPSGVHYSSDWMRDFAKMVEKYPDIVLISDEVYSELSYFDPKPTYFYQHNHDLLTRTVIVDGISKSLACTGLRLGFCIAPRELTTVVRKIQGQTTSGPNSLIQRAVIDFDFAHLESFLSPVREHLRRSAEILREKYREYGLSKCWYQSMSAFYYTVDFSRTPMFEEKYGDTSVDHSQEICEFLLDEFGIALVPSTDFGIKNAARLSLVLSEAPFMEAVDKLIRFLALKS
jgi:aspartate aminotransferase